MLRRLWGGGRQREEGRDCDKSESNPSAQRLAVAPDVRASVHEDGIALLHISTGRVFLCNQTGSRIWQGVVAGLSADAISEQISRDWGVGGGTGPAAHVLIRFSNSNSAGTCLHSNMA